MLAMLAEIRRDGRFALRQFARQPLSVLAAVLALAGSIGFTTAIYSTSDWLLNRPPGGVQEPDRLLTLRPSADGTPYSFTHAQYVALRSAQDGFVDIAAYGKVLGVVSTDQHATEAVLELVTGSYFPLLGLRPALGRTILPEDDVAGAPPVVMLTYRFWQSRFGGDPRIIGTTLRVNGQPARVIGVAPQTFQGGYNLDWNGPTSVWLPMSARFGDLSRLVTNNFPFFLITGRMTPAMTRERVVAKSGTWLASLPPGRSRGKITALAVTPSSQMRLRQERGRAQVFFRMLLSVSTLILGASSFVVANFFLGQLSRRRRELALRAALGASRGRVLRQLATEAVLIGAVATVLGFVFAIWLSRLMAATPRLYLRRSLMTEWLIDTVPIDLSIASVVAVIGACAVLVFGLLPAVLVSFRDPLDELKGRPEHRPARALRLTPRQMVLALQVALTVGLGIGAALHVASFARIARLTPGYVRAEQVLLARVFPSGLSKEQGDAFYRELLARLNSLPQVESASVGWNPPLSVGSNTVSLPGTGTSKDVGSSAVAPGFFAVHGIAVVAGREFEDNQDDAQNSMIVNRVLARQLWPDQEAVGQTVRYNDELRTVVAVVADDVCEDLLSGPTACAWRPFPMGTSSGYLRIRTRVEPMTLQPVLQRLVHEINPAVALSEVTTLDGYMADLIGRERFLAVGVMGLALFGILILAFGCVALFVADVHDRVREIAIRMALGASGGQLARRLTLRGLAVVGAGALAGAGATRLVAPRLANDLYNTSPTDAFVYGLVVTMVVGIGLASVLWSAWVAVRTEPSRHLSSPI